MITYEEIGRVLGLAAARDQRIVGDADVLAWHSDLNAASVSYADADAALTRFYAVEMAGLEPDQRRRVTTPDIISIARRIRGERLSNFMYEPPDGDEDPDYLRRLRNQIAATADGATPALTERPALEGGPHKDFIQELEARGYEVGRKVPDDDEAEEAPPKPKIKRAGPLGIECPTCKAAIGRPCKTGPVGSDKPLKELRKPHAARSRVASGGPARFDTPEEIEARRQASLAHLAELAAAEAESVADEGKPS